jgi:hypothetical protein
MDNILVVTLILSAVTLLFTLVLAACFIRLESRMDKCDSCIVGFNKRLNIHLKHITEFFERFKDISFRSNEVSLRFSRLEQRMNDMDQFKSCATQDIEQLYDKIYGAPLESRYTPLEQYNGFPDNLAKQHFDNNEVNDKIIYDSVTGEVREKPKNTKTEKKSKRKKV